MLMQCQQFADAAWKLMHPHTSAVEAMSVYLCFVSAFVQWMQPQRLLMDYRLYLAGLLIPVLSHLQRLESNLNYIFVSLLEENHQDFFKFEFPFLIMC